MINFVCIPQARRFDNLDDAYEVALEVPDVHAYRGLDFCVAVGDTLIDVDPEEADLAGLGAAIVVRNIAFRDLYIGS